MEEAETLPTSDDADQSTGGEEKPTPKQDSLHKNHHQEQRIKMVRVEMSQARQENQRLKRSLDQIMKDYEILKRQFHEITKKEGKKTTQTSANTINNDKVEEFEDMVSLTLGRFSSDQNKDHKMLDLGSLGVEKIKYNKTPSMENLPSPTDSEQAKEEEAGETWPPSEVSKSTSALAAGEDEVSEHNNPPKKTRVCVRVRCDTPTLNDGCQWRKYGQKIAKGNPCPRAYYRCTGAPSCPVRKQVQRSIDDMSILIITYEGTHNHPLPVSAMSMASTTSAAALMLLSGASSTSRLSLNPSPIGTSTTYLHGINMHLTNNTNSNQLYLPNSSMLSSSLNHPTITLDLTSNPPSTSSSPFHKIPSTYPSKHPFTSLDFGSPQPNFMSWNNNNSGYANNNQPYNISKNAIGMSSDLAKQLSPHSNIYGACLQQFTKPSTPPLPPLPLPDTIAAATKAITSDPSFQSALVAALSSIISGGNGGEAVQPIASYIQAAQAPPPLTGSTSKSSSSPSGSRDNNTK